MIPNIKSNEELQFLIRMYSGRRTFGEQYKDCKFGRLVHFTNHSEYIRKEAGGGYAPVYEGKFLELYTAKYATFDENLTGSMLLRGEALRPRPIAGRCLLHYCRLSRPASQYSCCNCRQRRKCFVSWQFLTLLYLTLLSVLRWRVWILHRRLSGSFPCRRRSASKRWFFSGM